MHMTLSPVQQHAFEALSTMFPWVSLGRAEVRYTVP
jgi:hypothetical protein